MLVVADTSVLINLARIGEARLLPQLFQRVVAPPLVCEEFARLAADEPRSHGTVWPEWVEVQAMDDKRMGTDEWMGMP